MNKVVSYIDNRKRADKITIALVPALAGIMAYAIVAFATAMSGAGTIENGIGQDYCKQFEGMGIGNYQNCLLAQDNYIKQVIMATAMLYGGLIISAMLASMFFLVHKMMEGKQ